MEVKLEVKEILSCRVRPFLMNVHYARRMPSIQYAFGLFEDGEMIGVCTYGQPASPSLCVGVGGKEYKMRVIELNRLCLLPGKNKPNYASKLVGQSLRKLPKGLYVVSYADTAWGHFGAIYQACNFLYTGLSANRTDVYIGDGKHSRHANGDKNIRQTRSSKHRYIYITGRGGMKNQLLRDLKYEVEPYPKGESVRYDYTDPKPVESVKVYRKES